MASGRHPPAYDRVLERRRAVALACHFREAESLSIARPQMFLRPMTWPGLSLA
jgi:hypothetical protein